MWVAYSWFSARKYSMQLLTLLWRFSLELCFLSSLYHCCPTQPSPVGYDPKWYALVCSTVLLSRNCYSWCDRHYPVTVEAHCNCPVTVHRSHMIVSHMFVGHLVSLTATKSCRLLCRPRKCHRWPCHAFETCQLSLTFRTIQDFVKASWPQLPRWRPVIGTVFLLSDLSDLSPMWQLSRISRAVCSSLHIPPLKNIVILDVSFMQQCWV